MTTCHACGQTWEMPPTFAVACPKCCAKPGHPCVDRKPSGHVHSAAFGGLHPWGHVEREREAMRQGRIERCPARVGSGDRRLEALDLFAGAV